MSSPNARTRQMYCELGFICEIVERYSPHPRPFGKKHDLFGIFDLVAFGFGRRVIGLQATSSSNLAERVEKIRRSPGYGIWLDMGYEIHAVGWSKRGKAGEQKTWQPRVVEMSRVTHPPLPGDPTQRVPAWFPTTPLAPMETEA